MKYEFPLIETIDDVLPHIEGLPEFIVAERDGYTVINYQVITPDTFPSTKVAGGSAKMRAERTLTAAIRRECRGIMFDDMGRIIRRPFHKFFNANENVETQANNIDFDAEHEILTKLDGSMIAPYQVGGQITWGTKMGDTDVAQPVNEFVRKHDNYKKMAAAAILMGMTPIFEWCSRQQRIVIDYGDEDQLILVAIRDMKTGTYTDYNVLCEWGEQFNIPVVNTNPKFDNIDDLIKFVREMIDEEGFVVRFADGHMVKVKSDWYVAIHKAKDAILWDRNIVKMVLDNDLDDVKAHLPRDDNDKLFDFEHDFWRYINEIEIKFMQAYSKATSDSNGDRKEFAINHADKVDKLFKQLIFRFWDNPPDEATLRSAIIDIVERHISRNSNWDELQKQWFPKLKFN